MEKDLISDLAAAARMYRIDTVLQINPSFPIFHSIRHLTFGSRPHTPRGPHGGRELSLNKPRGTLGLTPA